MLLLYVSGLNGSHFAVFFDNNMNIVNFNLG
jgi:hypothetical protein